MQLLKEPRHVLAKGGHRGHTLSIILHFANGMADTDIPVTRTGNDHLTDEEEMIDRVEGVNGASASHRYDCSPNFALEHVAVCASYHASAVNKRFEFGREVSEVRWRTQDDPVCFEHLGDVVVYRIVSYDTALIERLETLRTRDATLDLCSCELNQFGLYALFFEFAKHLLNKNGCVAILARTAVKSYNLYRNPLLILRSRERRFMTRTESRAYYCCVNFMRRLIAKPIDCAYLNSKKITLSPQALFICLAKKRRVRRIHRALAIHPSLWLVSHS